MMIGWDWGTEDKIELSNTSYKDPICSWKLGIDNDGKSVRSTRQWGLKDSIDYVAPILLNVNCV